MKYWVKYSVTNIVASSVVTINDGSTNIILDIADKLAINQEQVLSFRKYIAWLTSVKHIDNDDLLIILSTLEAAHLSGSRTLEQALIESVLDFYPNDKNFKKQAKIWRIKKFSFTQILEFIGVDKVIVTLLESGTSGNMPQAFKEAKKYLASSNQVSGSLKDDTPTNIILTLVAIAFILGMPFMLSEPYNNLIKIKKIVEPDSVVLMNFIVNNIVVIVFGIALTLVSLAFTFTNQTVFNKFKKIQPWKAVGHLKDLEGAMNFLPIYATLKNIGSLDVNIVNYYQEIQARIGSEIAASLKKGQPLSKAILYTSLPKRIAKQLSIIFEIDNAKIRSDVVESTIESLNIQIKKQAKKISNIMTGIRKASFFVVVGFILFFQSAGYQI